MTLLSSWHDAAVKAAVAASRGHTADCWKLCRQPAWFPVSSGGAAAGYLESEVEGCNTGVVQSVQHVALVANVVSHLSAWQHSKTEQYRWHESQHVPQQNRSAPPQAYNWWWPLCGGSNSVTSSMRGWRL